MNRKLFLYLNIIAIFILISMFLFVTFFSDYLPFFHLTRQICNLIIMQLFSLILLMGALNSNLSPGWKISSSLGALLILVQGFLMATQI